MSDAAWEDEVRARNWTAKSERSAAERTSKLVSSADRRACHPIETPKFGSWAKAWVDPAQGLRLAGLRTMTDRKPKKHEIAQAAS